MTNPNPFADDLLEILSRVKWEELRGGRVFISGGTGFFGCWLLESFLWANRTLKLRASATVLSRDPERFAARQPHLAHDPALELIRGDVCDFDFPEGSFTHAIHAATDASVALNTAEPLHMLDTCVAGTRRILDFAVSRGVRKILLTSSGAIYGKQSPSVLNLPESHAGVPDTMNPASAYAEGKRVAELLCAIYSRRYGIEAKIARCFAFTGPGLPLDTHFAAGNFIRDLLRGGPIRIAGDGTPWRSYLYVSDLMVWLWTILFRGESCRPYNVGSDREITIAGLAAAVASIGGNLAVEIARAHAEGAPGERYVPDVTRARVELRLDQTVSLAEGLRRTIAFAAGKAMA